MAKLFMNKKQFNIWVTNMVTSYNNRGNVFSNVRKLTLEESAITGKTIIMNIKTGKTSVNDVLADAYIDSGRDLWHETFNAVVKTFTN